MNYLKAFLSEGGWSSQSPGQRTWTELCILSHNRTTGDIRDYHSNGTVRFSTSGLIMSRTPSYLPYAIFSFYAQTTSIPAEARLGDPTEIRTHDFWLERPASFPFRR